VTAVSARGLWFAGRSARILLVEGAGSPAGRCALGPPIELAHVHLGHRATVGFVGLLGCECTATPARFRACGRATELTGVPVLIGRTCWSLMVGAFVVALGPSVGTALWCPPIIADVAVRVRCARGSLCIARGVRTFAPSRLRTLRRTTELACVALGLGRACRSLRVGPAVTTLRPSSAPARGAALVVAIGTFRVRRAVGGVRVGVVEGARLPSSAPTGGMPAVPTRTIQGRRIAGRLVRIGQRVGTARPSGGRALCIPSIAACVPLVLWSAIRLAGVLVRIIATRPSCGCARAGSRVAACVPDGLGFTVRPIIVHIVRTGGPSGAAAHAYATIMAGVTVGGGGAGGA